MATTNQPAKPTNTVLPDEEFNKKWDQENLYQNVKRMNDPRFGEVTIVKNNSTNEVLFVKEKMASSKNEASNDIRELKSRISLNHPHLQRLVNYSTTVKKELCSTHYISRGFYEFPRSDCQKEHLERKRNLTSFSSSELTHLNYQILDGLHHLHSRNITHGDIRPLTVGYHKAANQFQILDRLADPSPLEKLQASNIINKKELFISPELYKKLQGKDKTATYNPYKNDLYALGLTVLFLGNSDSVQDVYKPNGEFDQAKLNEHVKNFDAKYQAENPYLCTIVKSLLVPEAERPDSQKLISSLIPYDQYKIQETQGVRVHALPTYDTHVVHEAQPVAVHAEPPVQTEKVIINRAEQEANAYVDQSKNYYVNSTNLNTTQDNTNVTYSYPQPTYTYNAPTYTYANPEQSYTTYTYNQPTSTYVQAEPATYTYTQPTTYVQSEPVTYTYTQPTTYVQSEPVTYTYTQPTTTYTQPTTTYVQAEPVTYTYTQPTTTYSQPTTTYVQGENITYAQPTTTYVQSDPVTYSYIKPNATFVNASIDGTKGERKSYTTYGEKIERKSYTQYVTNPDGTKSVRKSYTHYVLNPDNTTTQQVITQATPTYVYAQPTTTYVQSAPVVERKSYTTQTIPTTTYVNSSPINYTQGTNYTFAPPSTVYTSYLPYTTGTTVERKAEGGVQEVQEAVDNKNGEVRTYYVNQPYTPTGVSRVIYQGAYEGQQYVPSTENRVYSTYTQPVSYVQGDNQTLSNNVEIRRGSFVPTQTETKIIKKKYIIEGDKVIEVEANENEEQHQQSYN